ncbi:MAG: methyltransferase domain-containing protein [Candidatus Moranbacteria bacterium]|nr:methyltransferase domain-containing protein [Candidatus Moranbacteria bacterium]MDD3964883.1 methyltransferase domain-containing protein [Candidatus Moranbacteria bacterium]
MEKFFEQERPKIIDTLEIASGNISLIHEMDRVATLEGKEINWGDAVVISDISQRDLVDEKTALSREAVREGKTPSKEMYVAFDNISMPFSDNSVKRIICRNFFSSFSDMSTNDGSQIDTEKVKKYRDEIYRVLVPGGYLFIHDTLSPKVSDQIFDEKLFNDRFDEVSVDATNDLNISVDFVSKIENKFGEKGDRGMRIFRKR